MASRLTRPQPLYARHAVAAERGAWAVASVIDWRAIDRELAYRTPTVLAAVREAALIESFHPVNLARLMHATWDDIDAGVCFSLEAYEGFKHFHALRRYLEAIDHAPAITEEELVALRAPRRGGAAAPERRRPEAARPTLQAPARRGGAAAPERRRPEAACPTLRAPDAFVDIGETQLIERLVEFMLSEHLAAYFFRRLGEQTEEPQLARLLGVIAADEVRHAQSASDLIAKRIRSDRAIVTRVLDAAVEFRHFGEEALGRAVPVAMHGDPLAIRTFARRIERLCGVRLVDHLKASL